MAGLQTENNPNQTGTMEQKPSMIAANFDVAQLVATVTAGPGRRQPQQQHDEEIGDDTALWCACLQELATRCRESDVAHVVAEHAVRITLSCNTVPLWLRSLLRTR